MVINSSSETSSTGFQVSFGSAVERIEAKETDEQLKTKLDLIYQEIIKIRSALEQIRNPLNLDKDRVIYAKAAVSTSGSDLGLTRGATDDADRVLSGVAQFSSMSSGNITINGTDIAIDVSADSLNDVISRINASAAGVTSSLFNVDQRFQVEADSTDQSLVLNSGTTGFFAALNMIDGTSEASFGTRESVDETIMPKTRASRIADAIDDLASAFNFIFAENEVEAAEDSSLEGFLEALRGDLKAAVQAGFSSTMTDVDSGYGIAFDFGTTADRVIDFSLIDKSDLIKKLTEEGDEVNELFFGLERKDDDGLIEKILNALESHEEFLKDIKGTSGVFVDTSA